MSKIQKISDEILERIVDGKPVLLGCEMLFDWAERLQAIAQKKMDIDDAIDDFISILDFDQIIAWANLLDVEINYPPVDDMWPDWQDLLAVEVGEVMRRIGESKSSPEAKAKKEG